MISYAEVAFKPDYIHLINLVFTLCLAALPETRFLQSRKLEGFIFLLINRITSGSRNPVILKMSSKDVLSHQANSIVSCSLGICLLCITRHQSNRITKLRQLDKADAGLETDAQNFRWSDVTNYHHLDSRGTPVRHF